MRCATCGTGEIRPMTGPGRTARYKIVEALPIPPDLLLSTCSRCGDLWLSKDERTALNAALKAAYDELVQHRASEALTELRDQRLRRSSIEQLAGLSPGYLSRLEKEKSTSPTLATLLMLLARNPGLVEQAWTMWQQGPDDGLYEAQLIADSVSPALDHD